MYHPNFEHFFPLKYASIVIDFHINYSKPEYSVNKQIKKITKLKPRLPLAPGSTNVEGIIGMQGWNQKSSF